MIILKWKDEIFENRHWVDPTSTWQKYKQTKWQNTDIDMSVWQNEHEIFRREN